jgi:hypothetical protein
MTSIIENDAPEQIEEEEESEPKKAGSLREALEMAHDELSSEEEGVGDSPEEPTQEEVKQDAPPEIDAEVEEYILAPNSMNKEEQEEFRKLSPSQQKFIARRYKQMRGDYGRQTEELNKTRQAFSKYAEAVRPYEERLRLLGKDPAAQVISALEWDKRIAEDPVRGLTQLAATHGLSLEQLVEMQRGLPPRPSPQMQQPQRPQADPAQVAERAAKQMMFQQEVDSFRAAKDDSGRPLHPYLEDVEKEVILQIGRVSEEKGRMPSTPQEVREFLSEAYNRAVWASPRTREALQKQQDQARERERQKEMAKKAQDAKRASSSITGVGGAAAVSNQKGKTWGEALELAAQELNYRG